VKCQSVVVCVPHYLEMSLMGACLFVFGGQPFAFALGNADRSQCVSVYPRYRVFP
jgi:hypothetical protein